MNKETFEQNKSRLDDPEFFKKIKEAIAERLDDIATDPRFETLGFPIDLGDKIRRGEKVEAARTIRDAIAGIGDDFRLTRDEIGELKKRFLETN